MEIQLCTYIYTLTHIHSSIYTHKTYTHIHVYIYSHIDTCTFIHMHACTYIHIHTCTQYTYEPCHKKVDLAYFILKLRFVLKTIICTFKKLSRKTGKILPKIELWLFQVETFDQDIPGLKER